MDDELILPMLCDARYEELKTEVANLFERYKVCSLPINAFELAARMGFHIVPYKAWPDRVEKLIARQKDGISFIYDDEVYILYNDEKTFERQNWTIMHEIAHRHLGHREESIVAGREAEFFAKYALIPPPLVHMLGIKTPDEIQAHFIASREAATYGMNYYQKWLRHHTATFTETENRILRLFAAA